MNKEINLSYVLTTFNKLEYLKIIIKDLISNCKEDEEIVVTDGGSNDGTKGFLESLYIEGKIHQFISEKDCGEGHGYNKGILMAKGEIIKLISDDDVFDYKIIQMVKRFMLNNPILDVIAGNMANLEIRMDEVIISEINCDQNFILYKKCGHPFWFNGQPMFIRRKSLPIIGLLNSSFVVVDVEFSLRITHNSKLKLCWLQDFVSIRIDNEKSNFNKYRDVIEIQNIQLLDFYTKGFSSSKNIINNELPFYKNNLIYRITRSLYVKLRNSFNIHFTTNNVKVEEPIVDKASQDIKIELSFEEAYMKGKEWLNFKFNSDELKILK